MLVGSGGDDRVSSIGHWGVNRWIFDENTLTFLPMTVDVFPRGRATEYQRIWCNSNNIAVFIVQLFDLGVLLALNVPQNVKDRRNGCPLRAWESGERVKIPVMDDITSMIDQELVVQNNVSHRSMDNLELYFLTRVRRVKVTLQIDSGTGNFECIALR